MHTNGLQGISRWWLGVRWVVWGGAAVLLLLPLLAMQFTGEVNWTWSDFVVMGTLLSLVCGAFELAIRTARSDTYVIAFGIGVATAFLTTWSNLAVGIIGNENNPANLMFFGVVAIAFFGSIIAGFTSRRMAYAMEAAALAQLAACVAALVLDGTYVFVITAVFAGMWLASAQLFRKAARQEAGSRAAS